VTAEQGEQRAFRLDAARLVLDSGTPEDRESSERSNVRRTSLQDVMRAADMTSTRA
jgi:hypothetical protein